MSLFPRYADRTPEESAHKLWLALVPKAGLVVSAPALVNAQVIAPANVSSEQRDLLQLVIYRAPDAQSEPEPTIPDFAAFTATMLGWSDRQLVEAPESLSVPLPAYQDELRSTHAVPDPMDPTKWRLLVTILPTFTDFDAAPEANDKHATGWRATPQERFERLLRETGVSAGLLFNGTALRLVYAPKGETSGYLTLEFLPMTRVDGRPVLGGLLCLLSESVVFSRDKGQSLTDLLVESRKYQATVSNALAGQVLGALHELLRGVQVADRASAKAGGSRMLDTVIPEHPDHLYGGLVHVLMRLVFILFAEDRGLMPADPVYADNYSVVGLFERLREDHALYADTMDQRFGAWAHLTSLFRLVHDGGKHAGLDLPERNGDLFNPDKYPFLEGRPLGVHRVMDQRFDPPKIPDGVVWEVLKRLLLHDGERLSYRTLDVEQIGSVYEAIMGFGVERTTGPALALKPKNVFVDLAKLLALPGDKRAAYLDSEAGCKPPPAAATALSAAKTVDDLATAVVKQTSDYAKSVLPPMALYLQPGEERRRSGSHYTPRELTSPIVATTLRPVLEALGPKPTPEQILALKVCDPAMGSGAFLVEACRQLGEHLVEAWNVHGLLPKIPADEEPRLYARRMVAKQCLYGVDKNPLAASLAKLSLWLVTLAKDHRFTFLNHALKHGDSLIGYTRQQIFMFSPMATGSVLDEKHGLFAGLLTNLGKAKADRQFIQTVDEDAEAAPGGLSVERAVREHFSDAESALAEARFKGDLLVAAFFGAQKPKERDALRVDYKNLWDDAQGRGTAAKVARESGEKIVRAMRTGDGAGRGVVPFHWEIEFPEVFDRENRGFDCFVGNPPFLGGTMIGGRIGLEFHDYIVETYAPATGLADIAAFFLRRCHDLLRAEGTFGLIATNTVAQGDTRGTGLQAITAAGSKIYEATKRRSWPGVATVVVSVVHVARMAGAMQARLDGVPVARVSAFLLAGVVDAMPAALTANRRRGYLGTKIWGAGFLFEANPSNGSSSLEDMRRLIDADPTNQDVIVPYMGGEEFNESPTLSPRRFVIEFGDCPESDARRWPSLFQIVEERVKPVRAGNKQRNYRDEWWRHANRVPEAETYAREHGRVLAVTSVSRNLSFGFAQRGTIMANSVAVLLLHSDADFAVMQSRVHELWARFSGSSFGDALRYTTPCFDTFPRPDSLNDEAERAGKTYYDFRAQLMIANNQGLTTTYNRFHDKLEESPAIKRLRNLHEAMDRAVLHAYGWDDVPTACEFIPEHADDPDEDESGRGGKPKKKHFRYRWPDAVRDDVLARLLDLNAKRAAEERASKDAVQPVKAAVAAKDASTPKKPVKAKKAPGKTDDARVINLFAPDKT